MVAWLDKLTNLSSSVRAEVSSPESPKKRDDTARFRRDGIEDAYAPKFLDNGLLFSYRIGEELPTIQP